MTTEKPVQQQSLASAPAPALPVKSALRSSRFLEPIDSKAGLVDEQPPLSPATAPHDVYLSSEEDASSSADDFSDYDFESDSDHSPGSFEQRRSHEDTARVVSFIFYGKPSIVHVRSRSTSPSSDQPPGPLLHHRPQRSSVDPNLARRRMSVSSTASTSILSTFTRSSTYIQSGHTRQKPSFLSIDPFASKSETEQSRRPHDYERPRTPTSMLKRTLSLARKRSRPALNQSVSLPGDSPSVQAEPEEGTREQEQGPEQEGPQPEPELEQHGAPTLRRTTVNLDGQKAVLRKANVAIPPQPPAESASRASYKSHSRLRSGLSISMGRRKQ